jgi:hypothetical protein
MYDKSTASAELERIKREIDLVDFAANEGYVRDKARSSRSQVVMAKGTGDGQHRMVIMRSSDDRWYYFSPTHPENKGTILDFARRLRGAGLAAVVTELRELLPGGGSQLPPRTPSSASAPSPHDGFDRARVLSALEWTTEGVRSTYLTKSRCVSEATLSSPRFRGTWRTDCYGNVVFPHHDDDGVCGFEKRGAYYKGFAEGGRKALYMSRSLPGDRALVFVEPGIDALSHFELQEQRDAMYASIAGQPGRWQWGHIQRVLQRYPHLEIVAAFDADAAGDRFANQLAEVAGRCVRRERPEWQLPWTIPTGAKLDWNYLLQERVRGGLDRGRAAGRNS